MMISGTTELIAHLGLPTGNFRAPMIYNPWFEHRRIDAAVVPMGSAAADFPAFLPLLFRLTNIRGALVTMPHKVTAAGLVDAPSLAVRVCNACNAVRRAADGRLIGDMFDGEGFLRAMAHSRRDVAGASALVLGCGGVGSAIAASLAQAGLARLSLFDLSPGAADALAARLNHHYPRMAITTGSSQPAGFGIIVNATPLGMSPADPLPLDPADIDPSCYVGDVVMAQAETAFLAGARQRGCKTQSGIDMLFEQIPAYLEFFGFPPATADELRDVSKLKS